MATDALPPTVEQARVTTPYSDTPLSPSETLDSAADGSELLRPHDAALGGVTSASYLGLLATQFLGALNDNIFRWLIVPIGKRMVPFEQQGAVVAAGLVMLVLPFVLCAAPAGFLSDRFSKRSVIVGSKVAEILVMLAGIAAIGSGQLWLMFMVLFLMGAQSAIFGPAKYGAIPELVRPDRIPLANGLIGLTTILAIIGGTVLGGVLFTYSYAADGGRAWIWGATIVGIAIVGTLTSLMIRRLPAASPRRAIPWNPLAETVTDLRRLVAARPLFLAAVGSAFFWSLAGLCQLTIDRLATSDLALSQVDSGLLLGLMALGVGLGNVGAGFISRGRIELGIVPVSGFGLAIAAFTLAAFAGVSGTRWNVTSLALVGMGFFAGAYDVPLASFLQYRSPRETRGSILAACNFLTFSATLLAAFVYWQLADTLHLSGRQILWGAGLITIPVSLLALRYVPTETLAFVMRNVMRMLYRVRVEGLEHFPGEGPALMVCNHVSWADGPILGLLAPRRPRMLVYAEYFDYWWLAWFGRLAGVVPIRPGKRSIVESLRTCRELLQAGEVVGIFPEGGLTRDGQMQPFQRGFLSVLKGVDAPVLPVAIDGMWGSIFSYEGGRCFTKWPTQWRRTITVRFGALLYEPQNAEEVRDVIQALKNGA